MLSIQRLKSKVQSPKSIVHRKPDGGLSSDARSDEQATQPFVTPSVALVNQSYSGERNWIDVSMVKFDSVVCRSAKKKSKS